MSRTVKIVLALVVVLAIGGGVGAWYVFGGDTPKEIPKLADDKSNTKPTKATALSGTWKVLKSNGSSVNDTVVRYRVNEKFAGGLATKTAVGHTGDVSGTVKVVSDSIPVATFRADLTTLESDRSQRDAAMHARGLETNTYPTATFTLVKPVALPTIQPGKVFTVKATGTLKLHNVTRTITASLDAKESGTTFVVRGQIPILMKDYKIDPPNVPGFVTVQDHGKLEVNLLLKKA